MSQDAERAEQIHFAFQYAMANNATAHAAYYDAISNGLDPVVALQHTIATLCEANKQLKFLRDRELVNQLVSLKQDESVRFDVVPGALNIEAREYNPRGFSDLRYELAVSIREIESAQFPLLGISVRDCLERLRDASRKHAAKNQPG